MKKKNSITKILLMLKSLIAGIKNGEFSKALARKYFDG